MSDAVAWVSGERERAANCQVTDLLEFRMLSRICKRLRHHQIIVSFLRRCQQW